MSQSQLEGHIEGIINIFHQYSVRVRHFDTLSAKELTQLLQKELSHFLKDQKNPGAIEKLFKELDQNKDMCISFGEFMQLICRVAIATHEHIQQEEEESQTKEVSTGARQPQHFEKLFEETDENKDRRLNFKEFLDLVSQVLMGRNGGRTLHQH